MLTESYFTLFFLCTSIVLLYEIIKAYRVISGLQEEKRQLRNKLDAWIAFDEGENNND